MKLLVLDPRSGDFTADLFVIDSASGRVRLLPLGYVPEIHHDAATGQLVVVETELDEASGAARHHWLKCFDLDTLRLLHRQEIPRRPMYAGFPGRSTRVFAEPSGRFLYTLQSTMLLRHPAAEDVFRLHVQRYDRVRGVLEVAPVIDSCMLDFGYLGGRADEFYFHLSCDCPSTVVFATFGSPELTWVRLEDLPPRVHGPQETCGSWSSREEGCLYGVTGEGKIYRVRRSPPQSSLLTTLPLRPPRSIPLAMLYGGGGQLFVGMAVDQSQRGLGLAGEVAQVCLARAELIRVTPLPLPVINFTTTADGRTLAGVNPYERTLFLLDSHTGREIKRVRDLGVSPAEVLLVP